MFNKLTRSIVISLMILLTLCVNTFNIVGEDTGSVTIDLIHQEDKDGKRIDTPIPGVEFDVYQLWTYENVSDEETKILLNNSFENKVEITSDMSEDEIQKKALTFMENIEGKDPLLTTSKSDSNGRIVVSELKLGGYLFVMKDIVEYNGALYEVSPFIITVPRNINGDWLTDVNAFPKLEIVKDEPPLDKTVNDQKEYKLKVDYEIFYYTIKTNMPKLADEFEVYDTLEPVLEFAPYKSLDELIEVRIGSKKLSLDELKKQVKIDGQKLTVIFTKEQLKEYKEKEVVIKFNCRIRKGADLSKYIDKRVPNDCSYKLNNTFKKSDKVFVIPPPPPWNPPKTGIYIVDVVLGNPYYFGSFVLLILIFILGTLRKTRNNRI